MHDRHLEGSCSDSSSPASSCSSRQRSEEHTSELQSQSNLVCRLLLEKKNNSAPYQNASAARPLHWSAIIHVIVVQFCNVLQDGRSAMCRRCRLPTAVFTHVTKRTQLD